MSTVMERKGRPPAPPETPWLLVAAVSSVLLLTWLVSAVWLAVLVTVFSGLLVYRVYA